MLSLNVCIAHVTGFVTTIIQRTYHTLNSIQRSIQHVHVCQSFLYMSHNTHITHAYLAWQIFGA